MANPERDREVGQEDLPAPSRTDEPDDELSSSSSEARTAEQLPSEPVPSEERQESTGRSEHEADAGKRSGWQGNDSED